jgi:hypothetical protein
LVVAPSALAMGGTEASTSSSTPARLDRDVKYPLVNASHFSVSVAVL